VSDATRRRVLDVVAELGYEPNAAARALSTGRTRTIGVVAPFFTRSSVIERLRGIAPRLAADGYQMILFDVERPEQRDAAFRSLIGRVDGLLSISLAPSTADLDRLEAAGVSVVLVDHDHEHLPVVIVDDVEGGRIAVRHLLELGHRRIAFAGDTEDGVHGFPASSRRRVGYQEAIATAGLELSKDLVRVRPHGHASGGAIARELLSLREPPTAIFAASDMQALSLIEAAQGLGVKVPEELSVIGFDDIEVSRYAGLTTVAQPLGESGVRGAELLLADLAGGAGAEGDPARVVRLALRLVRRDTTAPPGQAFHLSRAGRKDRGRHRVTDDMMATS
jgi:DNA-binding LacI/PurR family transcriptional regulator